MKERTLGAIFRQLFAVYGQILEKHPWPCPVWQYIDANAGCGYNDEPDCEGSPIVFLNAARAAHLRYNASFVELDPQNALYLRAAIGPQDGCQVITGDNRVHVPVLVDQLPRNCYGLLYTDPNGVPDFDLLGQVSRRPRMRYMDILIRYSGAAVKRARIHHDQTLLGYLRQIDKQYWIVQTPSDKQYWIVQTPSDKQQWTFLLGMNWDGLREMKALGFHKAGSLEGQGIIERLNYTNQERLERRQPPLFPESEPPYHIYKDN